MNRQNSIRPHVVDLLVFIGLLGYVQPALLLFAKLTGHYEYHVAFSLASLFIVTGLMTVFREELKHPSFNLQLVVFGGYVISVAVILTGVLRG